MTDDILLIPSAILIPDELRLDLGPIPTGMIPLHGKPIIHHIIDQYDAVDPHIVCHARSEKIESYIQREELDWESIRIPETQSLGETILKSLEHLESAGKLIDKQVYIHFADTLVEPLAPDQKFNFVSYSVEHNPIRWTSFSTEDGRIESITRKGSPNVQGDQPVFTGVFGFTDPRAYRNSLSESVIHADEHSPDPFYSGLHTYLRDRSHHLLEVDQWIDVGHLDTYHKAKKQFLNVREFNELSVNGDRNRIQKTSERGETLRSEYDWYQRLPEVAKPFAPKIYDYDQDKPMLELEYVGYPSLRDLYLHGSHGLHLWNSIYDSLFSMLETFASETTDSELDASLRDMYVEKTRRRLSNVDESGPLWPFFEETVSINGIERPGVDQILTDLEPTLRRYGLLDVEEFTVIHGDLCFSNVLYDIRSGVIKLIDPRGSFGPHVVYGDQRYDLAKLRHSVVGKYDFVINDLFDASIDERSGAVEYTVHTDDSHREREVLFDNLLRQNYPDWYDQVLLIESLLYLSMVPLHADDTRRQQYMLAYGIERFDECTNGGT